MKDSKSTPAGTGPLMTTKDTVATYKLADMRRVFQLIEAEPYKQLQTRNRLSMQA